MHFTSVMYVYQLFMRYVDVGPFMNVTGWTTMITKEKEPELP